MFGQLRKREVYVVLLRVRGVPIRLIVRRWVVAQPAKAVHLSCLVPLAELRFCSFRRLQLPESPAGGEVSRQSDKVLRVSIGFVSTRDEFEKGGFRALYALSFGQGQA
jgi:hypothetical protein